MPWFWLVWALGAPPPSNEVDGATPAPTSSRGEAKAEPEGSDDDPVRHVAFDHPGRRVSAADLRDPFAPVHRSAPRSARELPVPSPVPYPHETSATSHPDLKDPFERGRPPTSPPQSHATHAPHPDLRDPFEARSGSGEQPGSPAGCRRATTSSGVPIQRPRALQPERTCSADSAPPLRDPFVAPQRPSTRR